MPGYVILYNWRIVGNQDFNTVTHVMNVTAISAIIAIAYII